MIGEERNGEVIGYVKNDNNNTIVLLVRADAIGGAVGDYHQGFCTSAVWNFCNGDNSRVSVSSFFKLYDT